MSFPLPPGKSPRFNPPPNWPAPPGWTPPPGWAPDPSWPPPPAGWQLWIADPGAAGTLPGAGMGAGARKSGRPPRWVIIAGAVVVGLVIVGVTSGIPGSSGGTSLSGGLSATCTLSAMGHDQENGQTMYYRNAQITLTAGGQSADVGSVQIVLFKNGKQISAELQDNNAFDPQIIAAGQTVTYPSGNDSPTGAASWVSGPHSGTRVPPTKATYLTRARS
jgi:hypothetical protein